MADQLKILIPDRNLETTIGNLTLKPFKFKQFNIALNILNRYVELFNNEFESNAQIAAALLGKAQDNYLVLQDIVNLLCLVTRKESTEIEDLQYDEVVSLLTECIDMNMDFFDQIARRVMKVEDSPAESLKTGESK